MSLAFHASPIDFTVNEKIPMKKKQLPIGQREETTVKEQNIQNILEILQVIVYVIFFTFKKKTNKTKKQKWRKENLNKICIKMKI